MNILNLAAIGFGILGAICYFDDQGKAESIAASIRDTARKEAIPKVNAFDKLNLEFKRSDAQRIMNEFNRTEQAKIETAFNSDPDAKKAVVELNKLTKQYNAAKKAVKNFKPDTVQIGAGSGDSAVAVSISNDSQKSVLESELVKVSAEKDAADAAVKEIKRSIAEKITNERPLAHTEAIENFNKLDSEYKEMTRQNNKLVEDLLKDDEWRHKEFVKNFQETHQFGEIIGKAVIFSIVPLLALFLIWKDAIQKITILKEVI